MQHIPWVTQYTLAQDGTRSPGSQSLDGCFTRCVSFQAVPVNLYHICLTPSFASISAPLAINSLAVAVRTFRHANINAVLLS
jgi:hypothetical protein